MCPVALPCTHPQFAASTCGRSALTRRPRRGSAFGEFAMASTGTHPAASMLFRIVDVPAERYPQPQVRRIELNKNNSVHNPVTVTIALLASRYSRTVLWLSLLSWDKLKIA